MAIQFKLQVLGKIAVWALLLPIVGFAIFCALTIVPLLGLLIPGRTTLMLYQAGFLPSLATVACFYFLRARIGAVRTAIVTAVASPLFAALWLTWLVPDAIYPASYMGNCLLASAMLSSLVMTLRPSRLRRGS